MTSIVRNNLYNVINRSNKIIISCCFVFFGFLLQKSAVNKDYKLVVNYQGFLEEVKNLRLLDKEYINKKYQIITATTMDSTDIVKKRLVDLKKLSQELRDSTQKGDAPDFNIIKAIIDITKDASPTKSGNFNSRLSLSQFMGDESSLVESNQSPRLRKVESKKLSVSSSKNYFNPFSPDVSPSRQKEDKRYQKDIRGSREMERSEILKRSSERIEEQRFLEQEEQWEPLFPKVAPLSKSPSQKASNHKLSSSSFVENGDHRELIELRKENAELQHKLKEMRERLNYYIQKQKQENEEEITSLMSPEKRFTSGFGKKRTPYFQLSDELNIFLTRLNVSDDDYQRIQYHSSEVRLTLDRIMIKKIKHSRNSNSEKQKYFNSSQNRNSILATNYEELSLNELKEVQYINERTLLLVFVDNSEMKANFFIQFDDAEELNKWDLGIYINFKIISVSTKEKRFQTEKQTNRQDKKHRETIYMNEDDMEDDEEQDPIMQTEKQLLKSYLEQKEKYVEIQKKLKETWLQKIQEAKNLRREKKESKLSDSQELEEKRYKTAKAHNSNQFDDVEKGKNSKKQKKQSVEQGKTFFLDDSFSKGQRNSKQKQTIDQILQKQEEKIRPPPLLLTETNKASNKIEQTNPKEGQQTSKALNGDAIYRKNDQILDQKEESKIQPIQSMEPIRSLQQIEKEERERKEQQLRIQQMQQEQKKLRDKTNLLEALKTLKKGIYMTKYAEGGFNAHQKKVYLSEDEKQLCWANKGSTDAKTVSMEDIVNIAKGELGPGIKKHIGKQAFSKSKNTFCVIHTNCKNRKLVEFGMKNEHLMEEFVDNMNLVRKRKQ